MTDQSSRNSRTSRTSTDDGAAKTTSPSPTAVAKRVTAELAELLGRDPEGVIALRRADAGWCVGIEVVEVRRIPDTADLIAEYEIETDRRGRLTSYRRVRRYQRGQAGDDR